MEDCRESMLFEMDEYAVHADEVYVPISAIQDYFRFHFEEL